MATTNDHLEKRKDPWSMKIENYILDDRTNSTIKKDLNNCYLVDREDKYENEEDEFKGFKDDLIESPERYLIEMNILDESDLAQKEIEVKKEKKQRKIVRLKRHKEYAPKKDNSMCIEENKFSFNRNKDKESGFNCFTKKDKRYGE